MKERERETDREKERDRERDRQTDRQRDTERERQTETDRQREREHLARSSGFSARGDIYFCIRSIRLWESEGRHTVSHTL